MRMRTVMPSPNPEIRTHPDCQQPRPPGASLRRPHKTRNWCRLLCCHPAPAPGASNLLLELRQLCEAGSGRGDPQLESGTTRSSVSQGAEAPMRVIPLQEARELAVRGIDGKGLHILDVLPDSFAHVPGCLPSL